ncbi:MAG: hypothetical protein LQ340_001823 [Diploschistes diacapsis]|nr:MAG: hypothetical protein LQ340_001823 [Diploschistes diacapsis]
MINTVEMSSERYLVDVGMNAKGPILPILLAENKAPIRSIAPRSVRLIRGFLPESTSRHEAHKCWQLEQRYGDDQPWISVYAFPDVEFIPADFAVMNWYVSTHRRSWFTHKVTVGKMLLDEHGKEIVGDLTLYEKVLKRRVRGQTELGISCQSEEERVRLLQQHFDIELNALQQRSICGTTSEIT